MELIPGQEAVTDGFIIRYAREDEAGVVLDLLSEVAGWLRSQNIE